MAETFAFDGGGSQAVSMRCGVRHGYWRASYPLASLRVSNEALVVESRLKSLNFTIRREDVVDFAPRWLGSLQVDFRAGGQADSLLLYGPTDRIAAALRAHGFSGSGDPSRMRQAWPAFKFLRVVWILAGLAAVSILGVAALAVLRAVYFTGN